MLLVAVLCAALTEYDLQEKAAGTGFLYRNVSIASVVACPSGETCLTVEGTLYRFHRLDATAVSLTGAAGGHTLAVVPDPAFTAYALFVRDGLSVRRLPMDRKPVTVLDPGTVVSLQVVGVGAAGPVVVWQKDLRPVAPEPWPGDLVAAMNALRKKTGVPPLVADESLLSAARQAVERVRKGKLAHYDGREGGIRHSGVRAAALGENLFTTQDDERGGLDSKQIREVAKQVQKLV